VIVENCPFCGEAATSERTLDETGWWYNTYGCESCDIWTDSLLKWNRRPALKNTPSTEIIDLLISEFESSSGHEGVQAIVYVAKGTHETHRGFICPQDVRSAREELQALKEHAEELANG